MSDSTSTHTSSQEKIVAAFSGWFMLLLTIAMFVGGIALILQQVSHGRAAISGAMLAAGAILIVLAGLLSGGFFTLQPN
ncbi:hypothetical protein NL529_29075, partial [Klebsiella pneumoniae]|nr:hypothetical protein [Klebsiella pneumoniae]